MDSSSLMKIFEFFKVIPLKMLWVLIVFPFGLELLTLNDDFKNFLNEYVLIKNITWVTGLFSLLCLIATYIEILIKKSRKIKDERKQQHDHELKEKEKEKEKDIQNLRKLLNLSHQAKYYLLIDFYCDQRKEHRIAEQSHGEKYGCYYELSRKNLVLMSQKNFNYAISSWEIVCRISPEAITILKRESVAEKIIASLPKEDQEQVREDISVYEEYYE